MLVQEDNWVMQPMLPLAITCGRSLSTLATSRSRRRWKQPLKAAKNGAGKIMDKEQVLAERRLRIERDGVAGLQDVALQIGFPQWTKGGDEAVCPIAITGLYGDLPPARGRDFFEALINGARTLRQHCRKPPQGTRLFYLGEPPYDREPYAGEPFGADELAAFREQIENLHREDWEVLVERRILMQEDGADERSEVVLQVGRPYWTFEGEQAACPIALRGAGEDEIEHRYGRDLFEALSNAVRDINERFSRPQCGRFFFWPDGEPYSGDFPDLAPPRRERDPRERSGNWQVIAERTLLMESEDDPKRRQITIKIGRPYWFEEGKEAACPMEIAGLSPDMPALHGEDIYMVLIFALDFFNNSYLRREGVRFFWPDGTPYDGEPLELPPTMSGSGGRPV